MLLLSKKGGNQMISFEEALEIARQRKDKIDNCTEYENAFVFGFSGDEGYVGGYGHTPVVIRKEDGRVLTMPEFICDGIGKEIRSFDI